MKEIAEAKSARLLSIYSRLANGDVLAKASLSAEYHVSERSIQRDMESLRCFFAEEHLEQDVIYDYSVKGYRLINTKQHGLSNSEILAVCKILLESRSMRQDEMYPILDKLIDCAIPAESQRSVKELVANEKFHYIPPHHDQPILDGLWEIGQAIQRRQVMEIEYERMKETKVVRRRIQPVGIMFSEYYFYLTAFLEDKQNFENPDDLFPTIYRIDRIKEYKVLNEHFRVPYQKRFEEGEFRKRIQFMFGGKLQTVTFRYTGPSVDAVLDRLPTAKVIAEDDDGWVLTAEVFGKGIEMWLLGQGKYVEVLKME